MSEWLSLKKAADLLGVHPTTLRRWADNGDIPVYVTPGGHRRFLESEINGILDQRMSNQLVPTDEILADRALIDTKRRLQDRQSHPEGLMAFSADERSRQRQIGQRLLGLIMQHIAMPSSDDSLLIEAKDIANEYALSCSRQGLSASQALEIVIFFKDGIVETALQTPQVAEYDDDMRLNLMRRINQIFNLLQVALVQHYE